MTRSSTQQDRHLDNCLWSKKIGTYTWKSKYYRNSKKRPNHNLKHLHIYTCSYSYSLPATNMMACLTTKYISLCSYQSTWLQPDISRCSYQSTWLQPSSPWSYQSTWLPPDISSWSYQSILEPLLLLDRLSASLLLILLCLAAPFFNTPRLILFSICILTISLSINNPHINETTFPVNQLTVRSTMKFTNAHDFFKCACLYITRLHGIYVHSLV